MLFSLHLFTCEEPRCKQRCSPAWRLAGGVCHSRARPAALWSPGSLLGLLSASLTPLTVPNTLTVSCSNTHINTWLHMLGATRHLCVVWMHTHTHTHAHTRHGHYSYWGSGCRVTCTRKSRCSTVMCVPTLPQQWTPPPPLHTHAHAHRVRRREGPVCALCIPLHFTFS